MSKASRLSCYRQCTPAWRHHYWEVQRRNKYGEVSAVACCHCGERIHGIQRCSVALARNENETRTT